MSVYKRRKPVTNKEHWVHLLCERCNDPFSVHPYFYKIRGGKFCSQNCSIQSRIRKYSVNENYFNIIDDDTIYHLGYIFAIGYINMDDDEVRMISERKEDIEYISKVLGSTYKITYHAENITKEKGWKIHIKSSKLVSELYSFGFTTDPFNQSFPDIPDRFASKFIEGFIAASDILVKVDKILLYIRSKSIMLRIQEEIGGEIGFDNGRFCLIREISI